MTADFTFRNEGSIYLVVPNNIEAKNAMVAHVGPDSQWFSGALAVEPRYVNSLREQLMDDGFDVEFDQRG
jgi:hypothetical protein